MPLPLLGAAAISVGTSAVKSLIGKNMDSNYNKSMMDYQNKLNNENATLAYNRQRALTEDSALLNKRGMAQAGINTAFGQNGNVTTASSPLSANTSLGSASPSSVGLGSLSLADDIIKAKQGNNVEADTKLKDSQREAQDINNSTQALRNIAEINKMIADTKDTNERARLTKMRNDLLEKYGDRQEKANTENLENVAGISAENLYQEQTKSAYLPAQLLNDVNQGLQTIENMKKDGKLTDEKIKETRQNIKNLKKMLDVYDSQISSNYASASDSLSHSKLNDRLSEGAKLDNEYNAKSLKNRIDEQSYRTISAKIATLPKNYRDIISRSHQWQVMINKLENNQALSEQEMKNLDDFLQLDFYDPYKNASLWTSFLNRFNK